MREHVLVTGSEGQLGKAFIDRMSADCAVTGVDLDELDIADRIRVREFVRGCRPSTIINCAAFTNVDGAESQPLEAIRANAEAVWNLARLADELGTVLLHFSTEFVWDGALDRPYTEEDEPAPQSVYGFSKLMGERFALTAGRSYVLRLSSLYGGHTGRTSVDWIIRQARANQPVTAFSDRTVSPSYVPDVVSASLELVRSVAPYGLYNCGSSDWCTWAELAAQVLDSVGRPDLLSPIPFVCQPNRAVRPRNCTMSSAKLERQVAVRPRSWRAALSDYLLRLGVSAAG